MTAACPRRKQQAGSSTKSCADHLPQLHLQVTQRQVSSSSFPVLLKFIIMLLLLACVNCSRMHATVATGSLVWTSDPTFFFF